MVNKKTVKIGGIILGASVGVTFFLSLLGTFFFPFSFLSIFSGLGIWVGIIILIVGLATNPPAAKIVARKVKITKRTPKKLKNKTSCKECKKQIPKNSKFCEHCGAKI